MYPTKKIDLFLGCSCHNREIYERDEIEIRLPLHFFLLFDPRGRPVVVIFSHRLSVSPSVRPSQNFKIKRKSLPAGNVGWPSGSLMTLVLTNVFSFHFKCATKLLEIFHEFWSANEHLYFTLSQLCRKRCFFSQ